MLEKELPDEDHNDGEYGHPSEQDPPVTRNPLLDQPHDCLRHSQCVPNVEILCSDVFEKVPLIFEAVHQAGPLSQHVVYFPVAAEQTVVLRSQILIHGNRFVILLPVDSSTLLME